jgi:hypothetical protein
MKGNIRLSMASRGRKTINYFRMINVPFGFENKYFIARGFSIEPNNKPTMTGNFDTVLFSFGVKLCLC